MDTKILPIDPTNLGTFRDSSKDLPLEDWTVSLNSSKDATHIQDAASRLKNTDTPVAFPTETVYGLGADATRSSAVRGIYAAKQRPSDNPLIVHFASISQLRRLLRPDGANEQHDDDPIPAIYKPLIRKFWPGPLTIILPNPENSPLAPEVTAGLSTFGARMPRDLLALTLIKLAGVPIAAPSANASTKPSPTAAEHVLHDLSERIELILDGGPCDVGVESTVVDGLCSPPAILRPGGVSLSQIRQCPGWEGTVIGYKDVSEKGSQPRAPGMKYRHYSPKAPVVLFEAGGKVPKWEELKNRAGERRSLGVVRTKTWEELQMEDADGEVPREKPDQMDMSTEVQQFIGGGEGHVPTDKASLDDLEADIKEQSLDELLAAAGYSISDDSTLTKTQPSNDEPMKSPITQMLSEFKRHRAHGITQYTISDITVYDLQLGPATEDVARGLFSALREMDAKDVDAIVVEGIDENEDDAAAAVMNRLRKAAEVKIGAE